MPAFASRCPFTDPERIFGDLEYARAEGAMPFSETYGARVVTGYDDIVTALHDPATFSSRPTVPDMPSPWREMFADRVPTRGTLLGIDNPDHDRLRSSVNTFFMPRKLARFEAWITEEAHRLVDEFARDGATDLKTSFALPLPLRVISHVVGIGADRGEWMGESLSFFLGDRDLYHNAGTPEEKALRLIELHEYLLEVMAARRDERRDDLISHIWNERDAGTLEMTDFEMLSMFPGLMLAGHETSSNLICMTLSHLLSDPALYAAAQRDDAARAAVLEEMFRFESAITGMKRIVSHDTELGGVPLREGEVVLLAYAAGSRDPDQFPHPETIDLSRSWATPHLGFGQGVHACLGAPLARLLLRIELKVLHERLPNLALAVPFEELQHTAVSEGRGIVALPLTWTPSAATARASTPEVVGEQPHGRPAVIRSRRLLTDSVVELTMSLEGELATWEPGAHIDLELPGGLVRQYSLCGLPEDDELRIAVLREPTGRGGSVAVFDELRPGQSVQVGGPRNHFALRDAAQFVFVAGGIGITPMLPMIAAAESRGADWRLVYLGRTRETMAYLAQLESSYVDHLTTWTTADERHRFDLGPLFADLSPDALVYGCGPESLLIGLEDAALAHDAADRVIVERFAPRQVHHGPDRPIDVVLARRGDTIRVDAEESVLDALNRAGAAVLSTCREGTCGTCEVGVIEGVPEHRDSVLSLDERMANATIMTCVSRCRGNRLVLDL